MYNTFLRFKLSKTEKLLPNYNYMFTFGFTTVIDLKKHNFFSRCRIESTVDPVSDFQSNMIFFSPPNRSQFSYFQYGFSCEHWVARS